MAEDDIVLTKRFAADSKEFKFFFPNAPRSSYVREWVQNLRFWEYGAHRRILQLARTRIPQGAFVDVGAGLGIESVLASDVYPLVYAFEVDKANIPYLIKNIESNRIRGCIVNKAVSELSENKIWIDESRIRFGATFEEVGEEVADGQLAETVALGDFPFEHDLSFLHIDTEGMESRVLLGAARSLKKQGTAPLIRLTFHPSRLREFESTAADLIKFFEIFHYSLFYPAPVQLAPISFTALQMLFEDWKDLSTHPWLTLYAFPEDAAVFASAI